MAETLVAIDTFAARLAAHREAATTRRDSMLPCPLTGHAAQAADTGSPFVPEQKQCETHGPYPLNARDADGTLRWHPPGCPACGRAQAARSLMQRAAIAPRFADCRFDNFQAATEAQRAVLAQCARYAREFGAMRERGICLILRGRPGTGKNHLATAIARSLLARGHTVLNATAHEIVRRVRDSWRRHENPHENPHAHAAGAMSEAQVIREFAALDLLIIDEVGRTYRSRDGAEPVELFNVIDARYRLRAPTLVISNLDGAGIEQALGAAAYDRLREGGGELVNFDWDSHRRIATED
ncbi:MAG TPA: ATP-binding protein [Burkholderiales bacterium]|nr:ATP-binding protein [Burkholderiales bacterium]